MGIEHINRFGWIVIGAILGCAIGLAVSANKQDYEGIASTDLSVFEQDVWQKELKTEIPLVRDILIHPPEYSEAEEATIQMVTYKRLARTKEGRQGWIDKRVVARVPYVPTRRGPVVPSSDLTVEKYLDEVAKERDVAIDYSTGWWLMPKTAAVTGMGIGIVLIGGIWPTLLGLMSGAGLGRKYNPKYKDDRPLWRVKSTAAPVGARPTVSAADMQRVGEVADAYEQNLGQFVGAGASSAAAPTATTEVRKLNAQQLEEATPLPNPDADDEIEVKGEYYPVMIHHHKKHDEQPGEPKKPGS